LIAIEYNLVPNYSLNKLVDFEVILTNQFNFIEQKLNCSIIRLAFMHHFAVDYLQIFIVKN